jgi:hexosaminidase
MTTKDAYKYFVLKAQEIAIHLNWIPVNWYGGYGLYTLP